ncbi:chorismate mutase [Methanofollis aquaemaris]|uniref:Chorismate mutase n=1 Tax=Methanofollis aquaemaris TaxID=126734 RepID=A0A8A3S6U0_9EURY|nr:chorismate mutase [Methanofollis aquaemaris]QSZ67579.1 chorismate mutase [Methanofollis aquaemaris]
MTIEEVRREIDRIDAGIIDLITARQAAAVRMAHEKYLAGAAVRDEERREALLEAAFEAAVEKQVDPVQVRRIFEILVEMSEERQREWTGEGNLP